MAPVSLLLFSAIIYTTIGETPQGVISFDTITFNKLVDGSRNVFIKFDKKYAYGDNEDAWKDFAANYAMTPELILGEVGISDYGENSNEDLGNTYEINKDDYPQYRLFLANANVDEPIKYEYSGNVIKDELAQFVRKNGIYLALDGCLKDFDGLTAQFMQAKDKTQRDKIGSDGKTLLDKYAGNEMEEKSGKYYMKVMAKITKEGDGYVGNEIKRLDSLLNGETYISDGRKPWFRKRLNILSVFEEYLSECKTEL